MFLVEQTFFYSKCYQSQSENLTNLIILAITCISAACGNTWSQEVPRLHQSLFCYKICREEHKTTQVFAAHHLYVTLAVMLACLLVLCLMPKGVWVKILHVIVQSCSMQVTRFIKYQSSCISL